MPFFDYLDGIHRRLHPIFTDSFLASLDRLPADHPMNRTDLVTAVELVIEPAEGKLSRIGIIKTSGVGTFDIAVLDAFVRAAPFGKAPPEIVSHDGNVHVQWEMHRDLKACSTLNARPFLLGPGQPPR